MIALPSTNVGACAIDARAVSKFFGNTAILHDVTFSLDHGERGLLLGAAGSGKTTLLKILAGHVTPSGGRVRISGVDARSSRLALHSRVGFVGQHSGPTGTMRMTDLLTFSGQAKRLPPAVLEQRIAAVVDRCALAAFEHSYPHGDSGLRVRAALSLALLHAPQVLLLDDCLAGLERDEIRTIVRILDTLREAKVTVLVSGRPSVRTSLTADEVFELRHGRLHQEAHA